MKMDMKTDMREISKNDLALERNSIRTQTPKDVHNDSERSETCRLCVPCHLFMPLYVLHIYLPQD